MPPRKSDVAKATSEEVGVGAPSASTPAKEAAHKEKDGVNIEDLNLPKSIVTRLAKGVLPPSTQIQGNAMLAMTKSATVFVGYLAAHANEYAQAANRKTVTPADVLRALEDLEFGEFRPRLEAELEVFNENAARKRAGAKKKGGGEGGGGGGTEGEEAEVGGGCRGGGEDHEEETVLEDHEEGEEEHEGDDEPDDEVEDDGEEEEQDEDHHDDDGEDRVENGRDEDEALDNGEDSD
ncbi:hypothetical protein GMDG_04267 [Pseudogymnoascus destructans 20631-21]|uniref:DNA polymerase epsilon subunit D n=1 Tax=Pseudogymnoascus destructans (strain ATCC MYA-4855 / 20631-21) TaxID=658429 RepID=L8GAV8_PSED2|nr:hypothetical protein GMDG_04267 [Pseudogymnoascus destructans 20631-21]